VIDRDDKDDTMLRTIVADDDPLVRRLIRDTLQRADVTVVAEASTGREAVELALFYRPDVVVMDFMMPEMDGIEATRRIYENDPSIRVVLLTGAGDDELGLRGLRAGAAGGFLPLVGQVKPPLDGCPTPPGQKNPPRELWLPLPWPRQGPDQEDPIGD
jgi:CheY-like chemotaxis protein